MVIPIPGDVTRNNNVSVLALNSDVQPGGHHGNHWSVSPGVRDSLQETQTAQQILLLGLLLWSLLLPRRQSEAWCPVSARRAEATVEKKRALLASFDVLLWRLR